MTCFVRKFLLFIMPILILCASLEILIRKIPNDYNLKRAFLDRNAHDIEVLFLGNSHAYRSINPLFIGAKSFNAAYVSQTIDYDYEIIKKYDNKLKSLKCLVMCISYGTLYSRLESSIESWRVKNYNIYYHMTASTKLKDYFEILSIKPRNNFKRLNDYYIKNRTPNVTSSELGWGKFKRSGKGDLIESGIEAARRHTHSGDGYFYENLDMLRAIINLSKERHIELVFYTPPAFHTYVEHLDGNQLNRTVATMTQLDLDNRNVVYVDYLKDSSFGETDFFNADHLNENGAEKFTRKIDEVIRGVVR